jgi:hypothetical protein
MLAPAAPAANARGIGLVAGMGPGRPGGGTLNFKRRTTMAHPRIALTCETVIDERRVTVFARALATVDAPLPTARPRALIRPARPGRRPDDVARASDPLPAPQPYLHPRAFKIPLKP